MRLYDPDDDRYERMGDCWGETAEETCLREALWLMERAEQRAREDGDVNSFWEYLRRDANICWWLDEEPHSSLAREIRQVGWDLAQELWEAEADADRAAVAVAAACG